MSTVEGKGGEPKSWIRQLIDDNPLTTWAALVVRFAEAVLFASGFQYAYKQSQDPYIGLLSLALGVVVSIYVVDIYLRLADGMLPFLPKKRKWVRRAAMVALGAFVFYGFFKASANTHEAIDKLAAQTEVLV